MVSTFYGLNGKTALVTGSSRGIGRATGLLLAKLGAEVVFHGSRNSARLDSAVAEAGGDEEEDGGGGGGDYGSTPPSPGTDGGGDGTGYETNLPGGDGVDGLGAGGGGSGFGYNGTARGGYGGCGVVIVAYDLVPAGTMILVK